MNATEHPASIAAVVLAAGWSSRMGSFKPLMPFGGRSVLAHVVASLRAAGVGDIRVVTGHNAEAVAIEARRVGAEPVHNAGFDSGMFSSVQTGLAVLPAAVAGTLILPVDIPLVRPATIARVMAAALASQAPVVHPVFRGERGHPPFIRRTLFGEILAGHDRLRDILDRHAREALDVPVFDRGSLRDMDYPEDHARLVEALARHGVPDGLECEAMLDFVGTLAPTRAHSRAVARLATNIAGRLRAAGMGIDVELVEAAALLHDIAKTEPDHARVGARLVTEFGFGAVADIIGRHMQLPDGEPPLSEASVVYLADKLTAGEGRVTLAERFAPALARFADNPAAFAGARRRLAMAETVLAAVEAITTLPETAAPSDLTRQGARRQ